MRVHPTLAHVTAAALTPAIAAYIRWQRNALVVQAGALDRESQRRLALYFSAEALSEVRVAMTDGDVVPDLPFSGALRRVGISYPCTSALAGITLEDVIAMKPSLPGYVLFHELVHVVQFRLLGVGRFSFLYARGLLATGAYERIPLEVCAYELEERFQCSGEPFSVEAEVLAWHRDGRF
ncbi:MAG: hypothetical protein JNK87_23460 [Bryobacterales bacterium]|nr:hypothetical protein [Bryobacterales bacterium]